MIAGIRQWFTLTSHHQGGKGKHQQHSHHTTLTAGIEIALRFSNNDDRRNVINMGRSLGWRPKCDVELNNEAWLNPHQSLQLSNMITSCFVDVVVDRVWIPRDVIEECLPCFKELKRTELYLYARFKFYDQGLY